MKRVIIIISLSLLLAGHVIGQSDWQPLSIEELELVYAEISAAYQTESYRFDIRHQSFKGHNSQQPHDEMTGFFAKTGNCYHSNMLGSEVLQNERHMIIMQHTYQELQLHDSRDQFADQIATMTSEDRSQYSAIAHRKAKRYREYRITYRKNGGIEQLTFRILPSGFLDEMVLYLPAMDRTVATAESLKPKVRVVFENLEVDYVANRGEYDTVQYLHIDRKAVKAGEKAAGYDIKDMRLSVK